MNDFVIRVSNTGFDYATERTNPKNKKPYETIEKDRLFNNLLSSQPMAFNLFCPLRQILKELPEVATLVIKAALPDYPIHRVMNVDLEFIPGNYMELTGDKSAMDAIIEFVDTDGRDGFIAIETKYSENLGTNVAYDRDENGKKIPRAKTIEAVKKLQCFKPNIEKLIVEGEKGLTQIYRNFLLSEMYGFERLQSYSLILAPKEHPSTVEEFNSLYNELHEEYQQKIKSIQQQSSLVIKIFFN